jgi:hypothetical protein
MLPVRAAGQPDLPARPAGQGRARPRARAVGHARDHFHGHGPARKVTWLQAASRRTLSGDSVGYLAAPARHRRPARPARAAFYGRTNAVGANAAVILARQFRQYQDAAGNAVISGVFYDAAGGVNHALTQMVSELEPSRPSPRPPSTSRLRTSRPCTAPSPIPTTRAGV